MSGIVARFLGNAGRPNRVEALLGQALFGGDRALVEELADRAEFMAIRAGDTLIEQGERTMISFSWLQDRWGSS